MFLTLALDIVDELCPGGGPGLHEELRLVDPV